MSKKYKPKTDWNKEIKNSGGIALRVTGKVFTYILNTVMTLLLIGLITGTIVGIAFGFYIKNYIDVDMSDFELLAVDQSMTTRLYYMDYTDRENRVGTPVEIEDQQLFSTENRTWVSYEEMPQNLVEAFISIEDERFWQHDGVDWKRTFGATFYYVTGRASYGGSTITQQLIKNVTGENDFSIQRKIKEIMSALELEKTMEKDDIIEMYLNTIYLSQHSYGVQAASQTYFNKDVSDLTLVECAALAAIPKFPYKYDPYANPDKNNERRDDVLWKMEDLGKITEEEYNEAINAELVLSEDVKSSNVSSTTSWYTDAVIDECISLLVEHLGVQEPVAQQMVYTGGLRIYTVMDPTIQDKMEAYFENEDNFPKINEGVQPEASMVVIDPATGDVLGLVGGRGVKSSSRLLNYATQTTRSPGSSIKPVAVYAPALEYGLINYGTVYDDSPVSRNWPVNYPNRYEGEVTINYAIQVSKNTIAVKVLNDLGFDASYEFVHDKLGMTSVIDEYTTASGKVLTDKNPSALALGGMNFGVTLKELTAAYQIFPNEGVFNGSRTVVKILDSAGNVLVDNSGTSEQVISASNAFIMTTMMENVVDYGTASKLTLKNRVDVAGKTGTTSDDFDRWFVGYTPYYLGGVWFGYSTPMSLNGFSETRSPALQIWDNVMAELHQPIFDDYNSGYSDLDSFESNTNVKRVWICSISGRLATEACGDDSVVAYYSPDRIPGSYCTYHEEEEEETSSDDSSVEGDDTTTGEDDTTAVDDTTAESDTTAPEDTTETTVDTTVPEETTSAPESQVVVEE